MKLYYSKGACSLAIRIMLNELGISFESEAVDLRAHTTASGKDYYSVNPKGYVPALVLDNGQTLTEVISILSYLSELKSAPNAADRLKQLEWLAFISTELHKAVGSLFGYPNGPAEVVKAIKERVIKRLDYVEKHLAKQEYLVGNSFGPADAYLVTILNWCPLLSVDISGLANVGAYVKRLQARPAIQQSLLQEGLIK